EIVSLWPTLARLVQRRGRAVLWRPCQPTGEPAQDRIRAVLPLGWLAVLAYSRHRRRERPQRGLPIERSPDDSAGGGARGAQQPDPARAGLPGALSAELATVIGGQPVLSEPEPGSGPALGPLLAAHGAALGPHATPRRAWRVGAFATGNGGAGIVRLDRPT